MSRIKQDHSRFRDIVRGRVRDNLRDYISQGELIGKEGGKAVKVPFPQIDLPRFRFSSSDQGGVGQGSGKPGDSLGPNSGKPGEEPGEGEAGGCLEDESEGTKC